MQDVNLRQVFDAFCEIYAPARELMAGGTLLGELKGAPLRCSLDGARYSRAGHAGHRRGRRQHLRLHRRRHRQGDGDRHAGRRGAARQGREQRLADAAVRADYEAALRALKPRFELYEQGQPRQRPPLAGRPGDLARRASSPRILRRMSGVLEETANPGNLVSARGIAKLFLPIR